MSEVKLERNIYLDIDMDFFVAPVEKTSVDNIRLYHDRSCSTMPVEPLVRQLRQQGLCWTADKISGFTNHKTSYIHWWMSKKTDNLLVHIDAHSDMYRNSRSDLRLLHNGDIGCHNYIWYGIRDGFIGEVIWVIPDSMDYLLQVDQAEHIVSKELIQKKYEDAKGVHMILECTTITGDVKHIPFHVCKAEQLPELCGNCSKVTIATSPEFIPEEADALVYELFEAFGAPASTAENIYRQHKEMLKRSEEEIKEAWSKLKE